LFFDGPFDGRPVDLPFQVSQAKGDVFRNRERFGKHQFLMHHGDPALVCIAG